MPTYRNRYACFFSESEDTVKTYMYQICVTHSFSNLIIHMISNQIRRTLSAVDDSMNYYCPWPGVLVLKCIGRPQHLGATDLKVHRKDITIV